jgi:hypothetical protein
MTHRAPWECTFAKEQRSRCLPGKKPRMDREYFEILSLCILQAGLGWASVRRSWPRYRTALLNCEIASSRMQLPQRCSAGRARRVTRRSSAPLLPTRRSSSASARSTAR